MLKKLSIYGLTLLIVAGILGGCSTATTNQAKVSPSPEPPKTVKIKVGAAVVPHAEILNYVKPKLLAEGVDLEVVTLDDEAQLNPALKEKQIDANYFQHVPYLDSVSKEKGYEFKAFAGVHVEPMGFYSSKIKSLDELKSGAKIAVPNNPSNEYRALALLQAQKLIKLKDGITNYSATPRDIVDNPKKLQFVEVEAAQLARTLPDVDGAVINTNFVLEAKIDPKTALFREGIGSPYTNYVVVRNGEEDRIELLKLRRLLLSEDVRKFITEKYGVAVVPAF